jgi:uncharacterized membrane protein
MLDPREKQRRTRTVMLAGMTGFVLVSIMMLIMTPTPRGAIETHQRWIYIAQVAVPSGLLTMSLTYFLVRRQR